MIVKAKVERYKKDMILGDKKFQSFVGKHYLARKGDVLNIKLTGYQICCDLMKTAIEGGFIIFGEAESTPNKNPYLNIYRIEVYPSGSITHEMAIKYCPWCREEIIIDLMDSEE